MSFTDFLLGLVLINVISAVIALFKTPNNLRHLRVSERENRNGNIYAFTDIGQIFPVVKIGRAQDAQSRLSSHRTAAPFGLLIYCIATTSDDIYAENYLHRKYRRWRISKKNEWFFMHPVMFYELIFMNIFRRRFIIV